MPPRKRQAKKPAKYDDDAEFQSDDEEDVVVNEEEHVKVEEEEEEEDVKPSKKRKAKAKGSSPKAKGSTPKKPQYDKLTKPTETEGGWTLQPPSLIYRGFEGEGSKKVAAFDFDGTLALQKSAAPWPRDENDWVLFNKTVPGKLQELVKDGYRVVIFSNQGGIKTALTGKAAKNATGRVSNVLDAIDLQLPVMLATNKDQYRKPSTGMWDFFVENGNGAVQPDLSESFFVGDASGTADSFADSDKKFAENIGIDFKTSKEFFGDPDGKVAPNAVGSSGLNNDMAQAFRNLAAASEAQGANAFGIRALNKSADIIAAFSEKITSGKQLSSLKGIGKGTVAKIDEFLSTGTLAGLSPVKEAGASANTAAADMALKFA